MKAVLKQKADSLQEPKAKETGDKRLAYVDTAVKNEEFHRIKLRDTQKAQYPKEIKNMIESHNFYVKKINEKGDFPNDFVDNSDGTLTDRVTGLMWGKDGSSKLYQYYGAEKYIFGLNNEKFAGYNDWRIPTLEELCSLLERGKNENGLHMSPLFTHKSSFVLNLDLPVGIHYAESCDMHHAIDFETGVITEVATKHESWCHTRKFYVKAVRTIK